MRIDLLRDLLNSKYQDSWIDFEIETILGDLNLPGTVLNVDRIGVLKTLESNLGLFLEDVTLFFMFCEIASNTEVDFTTHTTPTILEICLGVVLLHKLYPEYSDYSDDVKHAISYFAREEGYSVKPKFLEKLILDNFLIPGQEVQDVINKEHACSIYLKEALSNDNF